MKKALLTFSILILTAVFSVFNLSCAVDESVRKIDQLMSYCFENDLFNGTVLVASNGKIIYKKAFGYSDFQTEEKLSLNSVFYLASISKTFTSTAIIMLKEQNKLSYQDKLSDFFPEFPPYADRVTIRHLLTHTAGIPDWTRSPVFRARPGDFLDDITNRDVLDFLIQQEALDFNPGEIYRYSNSGYLLLALIVEKVSGESFPLFMKKNIFDPLGMKNTIIPDKPQQKFSKRVIGYNNLGQKDDNNILTYGGGGIYSTVRDLYKWDRALYTDKLISQQSLKEALTPVVLTDGSVQINQSGYSYGFGWVLEGDNFDRAAFHDGGFNGFSAMFYRELETQNLIVFLTNKGSTFRVYPTLEAVLNILHDKPFEMPK